jgi:hypothetical protein
VVAEAAELEATLIRDVTTVQLILAVVAAEFLVPSQQEIQAVAEALVL